MASNSYDLLFKFISVGDSGVGKSCILLRFTNREYIPTETTIGIEFGSQVVTVEDRKLKLQIWDTAGQESFRSISRAYYRGAIGCLLVYDMTRRDSFNHLLTWLEDVRQHGNEDIITMLVANKSDLASKRVVSRAEGEAFAKKHNLLYIETSAKSGENVEEAFLELAQEIYSALNLSQDLTQIPEADLRRLEQHGVKIGPKRTLNINPNAPSSTSSPQCEC
ncbi:ras-related protein rab-2A-like protein [Polychytrium aggregatum]|uniref:ras-related protein rab-2A-like protein n=1 Tax=Polychytrium aggregatum TaxID=110093 RepID=UPI0022FEE6B3|nr:ras-related protein rab-2A-like protein [Polychytrium aggregatum]KAI9203115.1 ras-related protein rab-2A-like protein [Polychytrium aggregatum]